LKNLFILIFRILVEVDRIQSIVDSIGEQFTNFAFLLGQLHNVAFIIVFQLEIDSQQYSYGCVVIFELLVEVNKFKVHLVSDEQIIDLMG